MPVVTSVVQDRIRILRNEINQLKPGDKIGIDHLKARLAALLKDDKGLTASAVSYALGMVRKQIDQQSNGLSLIVGRNHVRIERKIATIFDQNMQEFFEEKRAIGNVLWSWLFDFALDPGLEVRESWSGNSRLTSKLALKRSNLRQKISVAIAVDAGSTNCIAVREFLAGTPSMPFIIRNAGPSHEGDASSQGRLISPVFITNSITIADDLGQSQHRHGLTIRVIGGTDRPDRKSICGELSLLWLRACQSEGKMISMDLSIIGTTGLSDKFRDGIVFGCDIAEEASIKSRLLAMSHFRIVTLDSTKIHNECCNSIFACLSGNEVDLIVTDSGQSPEERAKVEAFTKTCAEHGVGVLIAGLTSTK